MQPQSLREPTIEDGEEALRLAKYNGSRLPRTADGEEDGEVPRSTRASQAELKRKARRQMNRQRSN